MTLGIACRSTALVLALGAGETTVARTLAPAATPPPTAADALVWLAGWCVVLGSGWLALVGAVVAAQAARGGARARRQVRGCPAAWRRLVLVLCGAAVVAGTASPALAADGHDHPPVVVVQGLGGPGTLPMPSRPAGDLSADHARTPSRSPAAPRTHVVRRGDSLWQLARRELGARADDAAVARYVTRLYAANRAGIGADPDLIEPGTRLVLPTVTEERNHP